MLHVLNSCRRPFDSQGKWDHRQALYGKPCISPPYSSLQNTAVLVLYLQHELGYPTLMIPSNTTTTIPTSLPLARMAWSWWVLVFVYYRPAITSLGAKRLRPSWYVPAAVSSLIIHAHNALCGVLEAMKSPVWDGFEDLEFVLVFFCFFVVFENVLDVWKWWGK